MVKVPGLNSQPPTNLEPTKGPPPIDWKFNKRYSTSAVTVALFVPTYLPPPATSPAVAGLALTVMVLVVVACSGPARVNRQSPVQPVRESLVVMLFKSSCFKICRESFHPLPRKASMVLMFSSQGCRTKFFWLENERAREPLSPALSPQAGRERLSAFECGLTYIRGALQLSPREDYCPAPLRRRTWAQVD